MTDLFSEHMVSSMVGLLRTIVQESYLSSFWNKAEYLEEWQLVWIVNVGIEIYMLERLFNNAKLQCDYMRFLVNYLNIMSYIKYTLCVRYPCISSWSEFEKMIFHGLRRDIKERALSLERNGKKTDRIFFINLSNSSAYLNHLSYLLFI